MSDKSQVLKHITKYIFLGVIILCLLGCSKESVRVAVEDNTVQAPLVTPTPVIQEPPIQTPVKLFGDFTNVESNGEHQWGYSLEIWKQGNEIYGLFSGDSNSRIVGDPPTGILVDQVYNEKTGKLSFTTKLPFYNYNFDGILTKDKVVGRLTNNRTDKMEKIILKRDKGSDLRTMNEYSSYQEWKEYADRILKFRGPS